MPLARLLFDRPYLLLTLTALFWAGNAVIGRAMADEFPPVALTQLRWAGAAVLLLPFAWPHLRRDWPEIRRSLPLLVLLSLASITIFNTLQYAALGFTTAMNVVLLQSIMPLLIGVLTFALYRDRLTGAQIAGIVVSMVGVTLIVTGGEWRALLTLGLNIGDVMFLVALLVYALYSALLKRRPDIHQLSFLGVTVIVGTVLLLPLFGLELASGARPPLTSEALLTLAYVVLFPSLLATLFFNRGVELIGPNRAGPFFHLVPLFGAILSVVVLGERFAWFHALGAGLILAGVVVASRGASGSKIRMARGDAAT